MKSESEINQKLKQVIFRHRKNYVQDGLSRKPENCQHNRRVKLPIHTGNRATIRVCGYVDDDGELNDLVCDSTMAGDKQASDCPFFECRYTAADLKKRFKNKLGLGEEIVPIGLIAKEFPDIAALKWCLDPGKTDTEEPEGEQPDILALLGDKAEEPEIIPERPLVEENDGT